MICTTVNYVSRGFDMHLEHLGEKLHLEVSFQDLRRSRSINESGPILSLQVEHQKRAVPVEHEVKLLRAVGGLNPCSLFAEL
jgi:hypothetical protein